MKKIGYRTLCHPAHPEFRLANSPFYLMAHADFDYHEDMRKVLEKYGVNRSMYRIMTVLREHESANIGFLAERSLTKRNTASRIVERMVSKELANASPNPDDSRITEVALTKRGKDMLNSLTPIVGRQFQRAIDGIDDEELEHLVRVLQKISGNLNRLPLETPDSLPAQMRVVAAALPAGQAWSATAVGAAGTTVSRIEVAARRGHGIRLLNRAPSAALRATLKSAGDYVELHAAQLLGARDPKSEGLSVEVQPLDGKQARCSGVGLVLALCSHLHKKPLRGGLVIVGELAGATVKRVEHPAELIEAAVHQGARAILLPVSCRRALADVSDETATQIEMLFYATPSNALATALLV